MPERNTETENEKESESETNLHKDEWMLRPCNLYKEEYHDCTCLQGRFHQYFVFGEFLNCRQWKIDYDNCYLWQKYKNKEAYAELLSSEKQHRVQRLKGHFNNDVWEKRDKPPENWNAPLPDWLQEKSKSSYLNIAKEKLKTETEEKVECNNESSSCILM